VLLIIDAVQERRRGDAGDQDEDRGDDEAVYVDYPEEVPDEGGPDADTGADESSAEAGSDASQESSHESAVSAEDRGDDHT
jgi:hypothetical protein